MFKEPERWTSLDEVSKHLGVSKDSIRLWIKKEAIPYRRVGKLYKFKLSKIDAWVNSGASAKIE